MKKLIFIFMLIASMLTLSATVSAAEVTYKNLVTDESSIEEDFKLLGMDVNDYYLPTTYNYEKWYVVAMSEAYNADKSIQTYFYLYNPTVYDDYAPELTFVYTLNTIQKNYTVDKFLSVDLSRSLYKVRGFQYDYCVNADIAITRIGSFYDKLPDEEGNYQIAESYISDSTFKATNQHSLINQVVSMELNFDSTLIIEDFEVVSIRIEEDDGFIKDWNTIWSGFSTYMDLHFYNFNFPDRINPDRVVYAKFKYDYKTYEKAIYAGDNVARYDKLLSSTGSKIYEFNDDSRTLRVNDRSQELTFKTFFLGNRATSNEFGNLPVTDEHKKSFNYDCSVLLDSSYTLREDIKQYSPDLVNGGGYYIDIGDKYTYSTLDDIEFLELHYKENGILYKCQVVAPKVDEEDITDLTPAPIDPIVPETLWERFIDWFKDNFPKSLVIIVVIAVAIIALCVFAPQLVFGVLKGIISLIVYIFTLPIKLIKLIFKRE